MAILSVAALREHVNTELVDVAVQRLLDAAEEAIVDRAGAVGALTEQRGGGYPFISLNRPQASITSVTELLSGATAATTLATDDYRIRPGNMLLERLSTGTNPSSRWQGLVTVIYVPVDQDDTRIGVQIDLVKLALNYNPAVLEERIGEWAERFGYNSAWTPDEEREAILSRLDTSVGMLVVGSLRG